MGVQTKPHGANRRRGSTPSVLALFAVLALVLAACGSDDAASDEFPQAGETLTIVVPVPPGGGIDAGARGIAVPLAESLGIDVVVENIEGAGHRVGATHVYRDTDNHYSVLTGIIPTFSIGEIVFDGDYEAMNFEPIFGFAPDWVVVGVAEDSPHQTFDDLVAASQESPLLHGLTGAGSANSLQSAILVNESDLDYEEVPYQGAGDAHNAVLGGEVDFVLNTFSGIAQVDGIRILAVIANERHPFAPDIPTLTELGYDVPVITQVRGFWASPETPEEVLDALEAAFSAAFNSDEWAEFSEERGFLPTLYDRSEFTAIDEESYGLVEQYADAMQVD